MSAALQHLAAPCSRLLAAAAGVAGPHAGAASAQLTAVRNCCEMFAQLTRTAARTCPPPHVRGEPAEACCYCPLRPRDGQANNVIMIIMMAIISSPWQQQHHTSTLASNSCHFRHHRFRLHNSKMKSQLSRATLNVEL